MARVSARLWFDRQLNIHAWDRPGLSPLNWIIITLIIVSAGLFTLETEPDFDAVSDQGFAALNFFILILFALEFALRIWSAGESKGVKGLAARIRYAQPRWLTIDFIAFAPELVLIAWMSMGSGQLDLSLAALKVVRLLRLLKLAHFIPGARALLDTITSVRNELLASMLIACGLIYGSAVVIYFAERDANAAEFGSVSRSLWWSVVTLTTVGYGDVYPETLFGKFAAGLIAIAGVGLVALPSGIFAGAFIERIRTGRQLSRLQTGDQGQAQPNSDPEE